MPQPFTLFDCDGCVPRTEKVVGRVKPMRDAAFGGEVNAINSVALGLGVIELRINTGNGGFADGGSPSLDGEHKRGRGGLYNAFNIVTVTSC